MSTALGPFDRYICLHVAEVTFHLNLSVIMADVPLEVVRNDVKNHGPACQGQLTPLKMRSS